MLFGRLNECERVDPAARTGTRPVAATRSSSAGKRESAKSATCGYAAEQASDMTVLRASGSPDRVRLAFSGLADVLRPLFSRLDKLPRTTGGCARAPRWPSGPPAPVGRFAICAATLGFSARRPKMRPVLVIVDEAESLDRSSAEALLFAERRLDADRVALLFAVRDGRPTMFDIAELPELRLAPLDRDAAQVLLTSFAEVTIAPQVLERLPLAAAGNPLALVEIPALLSVEQLAGRSRSATSSRLRPPSSVLSCARSSLTGSGVSRGAAGGGGQRHGELDYDRVRADRARDIDPRSLVPSEKAALISISGACSSSAIPSLELRSTAQPPRWAGGLHTKPSRTQLLVSGSRPARVASAAALPRA